MRKRYPRKRERIDLRVRDNFIEIDLKFQQYCINNKIMESRVLRTLIKDYVLQHEPVIVTQAKRLDEFT